MVDRAAILTRQAQGYLRLARVAGFPCNWYRPLQPLNPISPGTLLGQTQAFICASANFKANAPSKDKKPDDWYAALDITQVQAGDILVTPLARTYFVAAIEDYAPARLVLCNHTATIRLPMPLATLGLQPDYGGDNPAEEQVIAAGWPCAVMPALRIEEGDAKLPSDVRMPSAEILLPIIPGVLLANTMRVVTEDGVQRIVSSAIETLQGWRCTAFLADA